VGESSFWYRPTRVVPDQRPLNGRCCCCCCYTISNDFALFFIVYCRGFQPLSRYGPHRNSKLGWRTPRPKAHRLQPYVLLVGPEHATGLQFFWGCLQTPWKLPVDPQWSSDHRLKTPGLLDSWKIKIVNIDLTSSLQVNPFGFS